MGSSKERVYLGANPGGQLGFSSLLTNTSDQKQQSSIPGNRSCGCEWTWGWGLGGGTRGRGGAGQWRGQGKVKTVHMLSWGGGGFILKFSIKYSVRLWYWRLV